MESNLIPCTNCNGQGLISTGDNKLDLKRGNTIVCPECTGTGKIEDTAPGAGTETGGDVGTGTGVGDPKAQDSSLNAPGGSGSSDSDNGGGAELGPQIGSRCLTDTNQPGHLDKNEAGDWVCIPE